MTREQFETQKFAAGQSVKHIDGRIMPLAGFDFGEGLIAAKWQGEIVWFRFEVVEVKP